MFLLCSLFLLALCAVQLPGDLIIGLRKCVSYPTIICVYKKLDQTRTRPRTVILLSFTMQSILQYRRIGLAVQRQLDRDQEKAVALTTGETVDKDSQLPIPAPSNQAPAAISVPPLSRSSTESLEVDTHKEEDNIDTDRSGDIKQTRTQLSQRTALGYALTGIHARDRTTHEGKGSKVFVVGWEGKDDPLNPRNHSTISRVLATLILATIGFVVIAASSIDTAVLPQASAEFGVSEVVESLATGMCAQAYFSP
jgi:hypothetical protein